MKQDLSCPLELHGCTLSHSDGAALASVILYNSVPRRVASFEAVLKWSAAGRSVAAPFRAENLRGAGRFCVALSTRRLPDADRLEVLFTAVSFEDGESWRAGDGVIVEISPIQPVPDGERIMLETVAGSDAVCYPCQDSQAWRCVCGKVNPNTADACGRCHRGHFTAIGFTPENVRFQYETRRDPAPGEADAEILRLQDALLRRDAKRLKRAVAMVLAALTLTALLLLIHPDAADAEESRPSAPIEFARSAEREECP